MRLRGFGSFVLILCLWEVTIFTIRVTEITLSLDLNAPKPNLDDACEKSNYARHRPLRRYDLQST